MEAAGPHRSLRGTKPVTLPTNTMPSWKARHNRIKWSLAVHGEIPLWPDIEDRYDLEVLPPQLES